MEFILFIILGIFKFTFIACYMIYQLIMDTIHDIGRKTGINKLLGIKNSWDK